MIARFAAVIPACLASAGIAAAQTPVASKPDVSVRNPHADPLRGGWYPWDPYQYRDYRRGVPVLTGFDVEIERALERILGMEILLPETAWNAHLEALAAGTADIAAGATKSEARSAFAYFSKPYRSETDVLILPKGAAGRYAFSTIDATRCSRPSRNKNSGSESLPASFMPTAASTRSLQIPPSRT